MLISITHTIFEAFDCNPSLNVRSAYLDISKAFDRVWHDGLIYKLKRCGVSGNLLSLVKSFLRDRKQRTVSNGQGSLWGDVSAGIPQGSLLLPLFFLVSGSSIVLPNLMEKLESVQYSAERAITGALRGTSREKLYTELGWESLSCRRWCRRLTLFFQIINNLTPVYTKDPIPPLRQ